MYVFKILQQLAVPISILYATVTPLQIRLEVDLVYVVHLVVVLDPSVWAVHPAVKMTIFQRIQKQPGKVQRAR